MSNNKKIRNRLNQIFSDIADPQGLESQPEEKKPLSRKQPEKQAKTDISTSRKENLHTGKLSLPETSSVTTTVITETDSGQVSTLSIPFSTGDTWSNIEVIDEKERKWNSEEQALVRDVVDQLTLALQNAKLFQQTQQQNSNLEILNEMGRELTTQLDIQQVLENVYKFTSQLIDTGSFFIALFNEENETISFPIVMLDQEHIEYANRSIGNGLTDHILRTCKPLMLNGDLSKQMEEIGVQFMAMGNSRPAVS